MAEWDSQALAREFFAGKTLRVARDLLGCYLVHCSPEGTLVGRVVETEAYLGPEDPACHSATGRSNRNSVMFGPAGVAYVYLIYGMYYCFNVTSDRPEVPAAVLIRALEPIAGIDLMKKRRKKEALKDLCSGPAKLAQAMNIGPEHNGLDLVESSLYFTRGSVSDEAVTVGPRVGISKAIDWQLRFMVAESQFISKR